MNNKNKLSIKEKNQIKRETVAVAIGSTAAAAVLMIAIGCTSCVMSCSDKNKTHTTYNINYGDVKVSGKYFENINKNNINVIVTPNGEHIIAIKDSNNNYYIIRDNEWYVIYLIDGANVSLMCEDGNLIVGKLIKFDAFLNDEEKSQKHFTFDDLLNIENRLNENKSLSLKSSRS